MERSPIEMTSALEQLTGQVRELEHRVRALELGSSAALPLSEGPPQQQEIYTPALVVQPALVLPPSVATGLIPVIGKAVLGIAGAYLLRALSESGILPGRVAVAVTVVYAALWLVSSVARQPGREPAGAIYALTAALIFFPMLWETTVNFKVLSPQAAACLLIALVVLASLLALYRNPALLTWVIVLPTAATAWVLMVVTGELTPFAYTLLAICAITESLSIHGRWKSIRPWVALLADAGVWLTIYVAAQPQSIESYRPVARPAAVLLCCSLMAIYGGSIAFRTVGLRRKITVFETLQIAAAFVLAVGGVLRLTGGAAALGAVCLLGAVVLYGAALLRFDPVTSARNYHIYVSFGLGLLLAGSILLIPRSTAAILWSGLAVTAMFLSARTARSMLAIHGAVLLVASALISGLLGYCRLAMIGAILPGGPPAVLWFVAAAAILAYLACSSAAPSGRWSRLLAASLVALAATAFLVQFIARFPEGGLSAHWLPTVRTLVVCAMALLLALAGASHRVALSNGVEGLEFSEERYRDGRSKRIELTWISYAAMALLVAKLFVEDFHGSPPAALAVSLLFYGAVLIFGPRLTRPRTRPARKPKSAAQSATQSKSTAPNINSSSPTSP